jgi:hypothetical protein
VCREKLTVRYSWVIIVHCLVTLNGCTGGSKVQLVNDSREIRPGTEPGWVQVSEGYLRDLAGLVDLCLHGAGNASKTHTIGSGTANEQGGE